MSAPRQFHVPKALCADGFGPTSTLDEMEFVAARPGKASGWATKVLNTENKKLLDELLGDDTHLPRGVLASAEGPEVIVSLVNHRGEQWTAANGWVASSAPYTSVDLTDSDVAFIVRAFREGSEAVVMRACVPRAFVSAAKAPAKDAPEGVSDVPEGSAVVAIVDSIDKDAVLELIAVAPGPQAFRRHDGQWYEDKGWVAVLASVKPPTMVQLTPEQISSVSSQVDSATKGEPFEAFKAADRSMYMPVRASAFLEELESERLERGIALNLALVAVAGRELSPADIKNTEQLRRYWLTGPGAAKIRWFTPGSWRRCYKNVVEYMGPKMAPGYCTNLSNRLGGPGVATHVGAEHG